MCPKIKLKFFNWRKKEERFENAPNNIDKFLGSGAK